MNKQENSRKPGQKTSLKDRRDWSSKKLVTETRKFVRRDPGGKNYKDVLRRRLFENARCHDDSIGVFDIDELIEFVWDEMDLVRIGIQNRINDNLVVIEERLCE